MSSSNLNSNPDPNRWKVLQVVNIGTLMSTMDIGIVNVGLPTMAHQFSTVLSQIQWVVTSYLLVMIVLLPIAGKVSDWLGRDKIYSFGFLIFSIGSLSIAISSSFTTLLIARCVQGIGATMIMANSQAIVRQVFPNHERGRALGMNAVVISLGTLLGPAVGGPLMSLVGWRALFLIHVPLGVAATLLGLRWFPKTKTSGLSKVDLPGSLMLALGISLLLLATSNHTYHGRSALIICEVSAGILLLLVLALYEKRIRHGVFDHELFTNREFVLGNLSACMINLTQIAALLSVTFYMQEMLGYSTTRVGLILGIQPLVMGMIAPFAGWYRDKFGIFLLSVAGPLLCAGSLACIGFAGSISLLNIVLQMILFGLGAGLFLSTNNAEIMSAIPPTKSSLAGSMLALIRYFGMVAGTGLTALFIGNLGGDQLSMISVLSGMRLLTLICCFLCLIAVSIGWYRRPRSCVPTDLSA